MREIKCKQESRFQSDKKRFNFICAETMDCVTEVRAKTKKEALMLFYKDDDQVWENIECGQGERISKSFVKEVEV